MCPTTCPMFAGELENGTDVRVTGQGRQYLPKHGPSALAGARAAAVRELEQRTANLNPNRLHLFHLHNEPKTKNATAEEHAKGAQRFVSGALKCCAASRPRVPGRCREYRPPRRSSSLCRRHGDRLAAHDPAGSLSLMVIASSWRSRVSSEGRASSGITTPANLVPAFPPSASRSTRPLFETNVPPPSVVRRR